jgi:hypothetical protein
MSFKSTLFPKYERDENNENEMDEACNTHGRDDNIVAYSLKAKIEDSQQSAVTRQRPVNYKEMVFSAQSVLMSAHATIKYVMP